MNDAGKTFERIAPSRPNGARATFVRGAKVRTCAVPEVPGTKLPEAQFMLTFAGLAIEDYAMSKERFLKAAAVAYEVMKPGVGG